MHRAHCWTQPRCESLLSDCLLRYRALKCTQPRCKSLLGLVNVLSLLLCLPQLVFCPYNCESHQCRTMPADPDCSRAMLQHPE